MSQEENKAVVRRLYEEVWNRHDPEAADEFVAPDVFTRDMVPEHRHGIDGFKHLVRWVHTASPDLHYDIEDIIAEGDMVTTFVTYSGTHTGEIRDVAPTGRRVSVKQAHWYRLADGKVVENWTVRDDLGMMQQMGVISMPGEGANSVSAEENKAVVRRMLEELFNQGNLDLVGEIMAPDFVEHDPNMPEDLHGPEEFKEYVSAYRSAFPNIHIEVEDQVAEGDRVATRWTGTGTHEGELMGISPTGNRVTVAGMDVSRISGGKIAESWSNYDVMGMMQQLGVIPSPEQSEEASPT